MWINFTGFLARNRTAAVLQPCSWGCWLVGRLAPLQHKGKQQMKPCWGGGCRIMGAHIWVHAHLQGYRSAPPPQHMESVYTIIAGNTFPW